MHHRDIALAIAKHDGIPDVGRTDQTTQGFALLVWPRASGGKQLGDVSYRRGRFRNFDSRRIMQESIDDAAYLRWHRRREKQRLSRERHQLADALNIWNETHVEHAVGLIDDEKLDTRKQQSPALEMIKQPARRGDQDVDPAGKLAVLVIK